MRLFEKRMVEIKFFKIPFQFVVCQTYSLCHCCYFCITTDLQSQVSRINKPSKKKIELKYADEDSIVKDKQTGKDIHRFLGNVNLLHNEVTMSCDSAYYSPDKNQVTAFSKIHIEQGDTLDLFGNYLFYDGKSEIANCNR